MQQIWQPFPRKAFQNRENLKDHPCLKHELAARSFIVCTLQRLGITDEVSQADRASNTRRSRLDPSTLTAGLLWYDARAACCWSLLRPLRLLPSPQTHLSYPVAASSDCGCV